MLFFGKKKKANSDTANITDKLTSLSAQQNLQGLNTPLPAAPIPVVGEQIPTEENVKPVELKPVAPVSYESEEIPKVETISNVELQNKEEYENNQGQPEINVSYPTLSFDSVAPVPTVVETNSVVDSPIIDVPKFEENSTDQVFETEFNQQSLESQPQPEVVTPAIFATQPVMTEDFVDVKEPVVSNPVSETPVEAVKPIEPQVELIQPVKVENKFCPNCGNRLEGDTCLLCGTKLQ